MTMPVEQPILTTANSDLDDFHPVLQRIYYARGIKNTYDLKKDLSALLPFSDLKGIEQAVKVLFAALMAQKKIMIIGDFDADGATSTAIAVLALKKMGYKKVDYLVPNRFEYGYGLTPEIVAVAAQKSPDLIITVDNGMSSIEGVAAAKEKNIQVLITDHHLAAEELPAAVAIVNPNQPRDEFKSKNLAGCGVIFYVLLALRSYLRQHDYFTTHNVSEPNMADYLDLVALGTVADVVKLDKNNRILVHQGISRIRTGHCRPGIKALLDVAEKNSKGLSATDLAFSIAPRLNAAGRLEDMSLGIECLITDDFEQALDIAKRLNALNFERKNIEKEMRDQAFKALNKKFFDEKMLPYGISLLDESWHQGVIGIVASRVKEQYHRPVIAFALLNDNELKGSARSINGLHIRDALDAIAKKNPGLITKFGGHAMAAGLSLEKANFSLFQQAFDDYVKSVLTEADLQQKIITDGELAVNELTLEVAELIKNSGPWGQGFSEPLFDGVFEVLEQRIVGQKHLKLSLKLTDKVINAIAFNIDVTVWPNYRCQKIHIVYRLAVNTFNDLSSIQLLVEQIKPLL